MTATPDARCCALCRRSGLTLACVRLEAAFTWAWLARAAARLNARSSRKDPHLWN